MTTIEREVWGVEIERKDGSKFLSCSGGIGIAPALLPNIANLRKWMRDLRSEGFKCRRIRLRLVIEEIA